jgi:hypothetical protein
MAEPRNAPKIQQWDTSLALGSAQCLIQALTVLTVTNTHPPLQALNPLGIKHIPNHSVCLDLVETTSGSTSDDTSCILSSVLKHRQPFDTVVEEQSVSVCQWQQVKMG